MTPTLATAIAIYRELGWHRLRWDGEAMPDLLDLPLGTEDQRSVARTALSTGDWDRDDEVRRHPYGRLRDADESVLTAFAIRVGVSPERAVALLRGGRGLHDETLVALVTERGRRFALGFVAECSAHDDRMWRDSLSPLGIVCLRLVESFDLPLPRQLSYAADWAVATRASLGLPFREHPLDGPPLPEPILTRRFADHVHLACDLGVPATGALGAIVPAGVDRGLLDREDALDIAFAALEAAVRPGDRKVWTRILTDDLGADAKEILARSALLTSVLGAGQPEAVEAFAPPLIAGLEGDALTEVALASLRVATKKARRAVLRSLAQRPRPAGRVADAITAALPVIDLAGDPASQHQLTAIRTAWGTGSPAATQTIDRSSTTATATHRWAMPPPVWQPPRFDPGEPSEEALLDATATLSVRPEDAWDIEVERFLALANAVAYDSPDRARQMLRGVRAGYRNGVWCIPDWCAGRTAGHMLQGRIAPDPLSAREVSVVARLGAVPCLLSTPSSLDLMVDPDDLVDRMARVAASGRAVNEADLVLALTRLDVPAADGSLARRFAALDVPMVLVDGRPIAGSAGDVTARLLDEPVIEPPERPPGPEPRAGRMRIDLPPALMPFAQHFRQPDRVEWFLILPAWGDAAFVDLAAHPGPGLGITLGQVARRRTPLGPLAAARLLGAQRHPHPVAAEASAQALVDAWQRGLLLPGRADVVHVDQQDGPTALAALAQALVALSPDGPTSVAWTFLDDLARVSAGSPRLLAGTLEVVQALETLAPDVVSAVHDGSAPAGALALPGLRALADRQSSGRAVVVARSIVATLPERATPGSTPSGDSPGVADFDRRWIPRPSAPAVIGDGASVSFHRVEPGVAGSMLGAEVRLPDEPGRRFVAVPLWNEALGHDGQCLCSEIGVPESTGSRVRFLVWNPPSQRLTISRPYPIVGVPSSGHLGPVTVTQLAVALAAADRSDPSARDGGALIRDLVETNRIDADGVRRAASVLFAQEAVDPGRVARILEWCPTTLATCWPILAAAVERAAGADRPPAWLTRVLTIALAHADTLREATDRGLLSFAGRPWPGLEQLSQRPGRSTAATKARRLRGILLS